MMSGVNAARFSLGWPATAVLRLTGSRPVLARPADSATGEEVLLEAVRVRPRTCEVRSIGELVPEVLAKYGVGAEPVQTVGLLA